MRAEDEFAELHFGAERVFEDRLAGIACIFRVDECFEHGLIEIGGANGALDHEILHGRTSGLTARLALQSLVNGQLDRREDGDCRLGKQNFLGLGARQIAERRTFGTFDAHRNNHGVGLVGDHGGAVIDLHQATGCGEPPFREDDQRFAVFHRLDQLARAERFGRIDGVGVHEFEERLHPPVAGHAGVDGKGRVRRHDGVQHRGIEQADVVGGDDGARTRLRQVFRALQFEIIERLEQEHADIFDAFLAPGAQHQNHGDEVAETKHEKQRAKAGALRLKHRHAERRRRHEGGLQHVARCNHARFAFYGRPGLDRRKRRHDVETAGDRQTKKVKTEAQSGQARKDFARACECRRDGHGRNGPGEIEAE